MGISLAAGWKLNVAAMIVAAASAWVAAMTAAAVLLLVRGAPQGTIAQTALAGTMVHLFLCMIAAAVVVLGKIELGSSFLYWLMTQYWMTLIALVIVFAKAMRTAPMENHPGKR
jgi:hypothetical protein